MDNDENEIIRNSFWSNFFNSSAKMTDIKDYISSVPIFKDLSPNEDLTTHKNYSQQELSCRGVYIF